MAGLFGFGLCLLDASLESFDAGRRVLVGNVVRSLQVKLEVVLGFCLGKVRGLGL
jgi:hypothetical protein